jgi:predicted nicotinamide N-methyase
MFSFSFISAAILGASMVVAADKKPDCLSACDLSHAQVPVPAGFTVPTVPPSFVGLGVGVQNYTYNATSGAYVCVFRK